MVACRAGGPLSREVRKENSVAEIRIKAEKEIMYRIDVQCASQDKTQFTITVQGDRHRTTRGTDSNLHSARSVLKGSADREQMVRPVPHLPSPRA